MPARKRYAKPTAKKMPPSGVNSNIEKPSSPFFSAMELTRMFVEVPMSVHTPPNIEANESGIRSFEALTSKSAATPITTGIKIATAAVLLMKAEMTPITLIMAATAPQ